jgi:hypothetical protein
MDDDSIRKRASLTLGPLVGLLEDKAFDSLMSTIIKVLCDLYGTTIAATFASFISANARPHHLEHRGQDPGCVHSMCGGHLQSINLHYTTLLHMTALECIQ